MSAVPYTLLKIITCIAPVLCYQLKTEWCSTNEKTGRCRPNFNCFKTLSIDSSTSTCSKEDHVCCEEINVPDIMCQEYAKYVYMGGDEMAKASFSQRNSSKTSVCASSHTPLIVGGEKAAEKEFPFVAAIGFGRNHENAKWSCGGALISENFVLSAAHCLKSEKEYARWVRLGTIRLKPSPNEQIRLITKKIVHPKYKLPSFMYDIILFKLQKPVTFTPYVRPACLNIHDTVQADTAIATGFGKLQYSSSIGSDDLMKVTLDINPFAICQKTFSHSRRQFPVGVHDSVLCAGVLKGGKDTCQGDSGGSLVVALDDPYCMYSIIGVTSFGLFCGFANSPAIYTRVSYFIPWIVKNVWMNNSDSNNH